MGDPVADELDRIRAAYDERDRRPAGDARRTWAHPAHALHLHELEWQVLAALRAAQVRLADSAVLDVGTGGGYLLHRLAELGAASAAGVELSPDRVARAAERYPGLDVRCANAADLPFPEGTFDVVTQFTCLSSVLDPAVRADVAREMLRVTRPGGIVLSYDLRPSPALLRAARRLGPAPADAATPTAALGPDELRRLFGDPERLRAVQLNLDVSELVGGRRPVVAVLRLVPPLRSHLLATFRRA